MYYFLNEKLIFPTVDRADEQGIVAIGGDLSPDRLLLAYRSGIFPWFSEDDPIIWWSPDPRFVMYPSELKVSKSMAQVLKKQLFKITFDTNFRSVITACQQVRRQGQSGTWITDEMLEAYCDLHALGYAHSVEAWQEGQLVGGLYGISLGKAFFGESMFASVSNASKAAYITLVQKLEKNNFQIIDCQVYTEHLESLGAIGIPRMLFIEKINQALEQETMQVSWQDL